MKTLVQDVTDFHNKFGVKMNVAPAFLESSLEDFRVDFIKEELDELQHALKTKDMVEVLDALVDIMYVTVGMGTIMGLPLEKAWDEVQRSNMEKISGKFAMENNVETTKPPRHESDVLKRKDWRAPDIKSIVDQALQK